MQRKAWMALKDKHCGIQEISVVSITPQHFPDESKF